MNNKLLGALSVACISLLFSACGSENSASAEDEYSSSVIASSSSSVLVSSSSSVIANEVTQSSSSEIASSSSSPRNDNSSSSIASSSSSPRNDNSSSSVIASSSSVVANEVTQSSSSVDESDDPENHLLTDGRDGQIYRTVTVGDQIWMAENLNFAYVERTEALDSSSYCYGNDPSNCEKYGRTYLWSAAMDSAALFSENGAGCGDGVECEEKYPVRGVCPQGWHLPSQAEAESLIAFVKKENNTDSVCTTLTSVYEWGCGVHAMYFWTSTEAGTNVTYIMSIEDEYSDVSFDLKDMLSMISVRCLKD
ncbi:MAG: hypothetical protein K6A31_08855 [Fibrobacter sp.]|nr:hypothetical protein [Fibrobacter sp.]